MKSFQNFINLAEKTVGSSGRPSEPLDPQEQDFEDFRREKSKRRTRPSIEAQRQRLENTPVLSDNEMRTQNPEATAAYEKDSAERKTRKTITVDTPEGQITAGGTSKSGKIPIQTASGKTIYVTPDEAVARAESGLKIPKSPVQNKPKSTVIKSTPTAPKPVAPSSVSLSVTRPPAPKVSAGPALSVSTPKPTTSQKLADTVVKAAKQVRSEIAAEKAAEKAKLMKGLGTAGKVLGVIGTGIEAKKGYDIAKAMGSSEKRSLGAGAARGLGSGLGGVVGGALGSVAGPIGSAVGATAGLTVGAELGSKAYDVITGDPKKKVTAQGVLSNIRKAVPQEVRSQVPEPVRRRFTDFVKTAGRTYGVWQKSQQSVNK